MLHYGLLGFNNMHPFKPISLVIYISLVRLVKKKYKIEQPTIK